MNKFMAVSACMAALLLAGCGESGPVFGFDRKGPDEFTVIRNRPLNVPPEINLRPPQPGAGQSTRNRGINQAQETLRMAGTAPGATAPVYPRPAAASPGEVALVRRVTAYYGVDPEIRRVINEESQQVVLEQDGFVNKILFWKDTPPAGETIDPDTESRRLRENEARGEAVNSGIVPVIVRRKSGPSSLN